MDPGVDFPVRGQAHLVEQALTYSFSTILDVGTGTGCAARAFDAAARAVTATGLSMNTYGVNKLGGRIKVVQDVDICAMTQFREGQFDAVWCAHVLEHVNNVGLALGELRRVLRAGGYLFLSVPPFKDAVVGGHLTPGWNVGLLMYNLINAGFGVRDGAFVTHGHNVAAFVRNVAADHPGLRYDSGDITTLRELFPSSVQAREGFYGNLKSVNWEWRVHVPLSFRLREASRTLAAQWLPPAVTRRVASLRTSRA